MSVRVEKGEIIGADGSRLPYVHLGKPPAKKGTAAWKDWAKDQFLDLVKAGYNYTQASEYLGATRKWFENQTQRDPEWYEEVKAMAAEGGTEFEFPIYKGNFADFLLDYAPFGYIPEHHKEIIEALEDPYAKLVLVLAWPEAAKSTLLTLWYPLYKLAKNPDIRIAIVSKSSPKAQDLLTRIKRYLTEPHLYEDSPRNFIEDYNGWKPVSNEMQWSQDQIFVRHRKSGERDPTVQALGIQKHIYGARLDLLIMDDALVSDNQQSELTRERIDNWFTNEARSRVQKGQTVIAGTRLLPHDLYSQWKKSWADNKLFRGIYLPAILDEYTENERPHWPEYWTLDGFDITEEIGGDEVVVGYQPGLRDFREEIGARDPARWRMVYQQEDVEESDSVFRQEHFDNAFALGEGRRLGQVFPHETLILGVDPATTGRAAAIVLAVDPTTRIRTVVDIFVGDHLGATGIRQQLIYQFWERYKDNKIAATVIETNFAPTLLGDETFLERADTYGTVIRKHTTIARGNKRGSKWDEEYGIGALAPLFGGGLIAFPNAGPDDRRRLQPLVDDMRVFPYADAAQDALVALWVANGEATVDYTRPPDYMTTAVGRGVPSVVTSRRR